MEEKRKNKVLIVLDSPQYKFKTDEYKSSLEGNYDVSIEICDYETRLIRLFHRTPIVGEFLSHISYWTLSLFHALRLLIKYNKAKHKIFINPIVGIFYSFFAQLLFKKETISITGFLFEPKKNKFYYSLRKLFVLISYSKVDKIIVFGSSEVAYYQEIFPQLKSKFLFVHYGRDYDFQGTEFSYTKPYISSGGRSNRDYPILFKSIEQLEQKGFDRTLLVATRPGAYDRKWINSKLIDVTHNVNVSQFGSFLSNSDFLILPVIDSVLSAGHMALFEALSKGKIILVTDIQSIRDYVSEKEVFFYDPKSNTDLALKIELISNNLTNDLFLHRALQGKALYDSKYCFLAFLERVLTTTL